MDTDVTLLSPIDNNDSLPLLAQTTHKPWLQSAYPLHLLARNGSPNEIEQLLIAGTDVNKEDLLSTRPLHVAAMSGHNEAVKLFLAYGAEIDDNSYYGTTALHLAIKHKHYDTALILLNEGHASPMISEVVKNVKKPTAFDLIVDDLGALLQEYEIYEDVDVLPQIDTIIELIDSMGPDLYNFMTKDGKRGETLPASATLKIYASYMDPCPQKEALLNLADKYPSDAEDSYVNAKLLMHVFPTGEDYDLKINDNLIPFRSEGFFSFYTTPFVTHSLEAYLDKLEQQADYDALKYSVFTNIESAYQNATQLYLEKTDMAACKEALAAYHEGKTLLLTSGWDGHFVNIILSKPQAIFASANSGQRYYKHKAGITFYDINDPDAIDEDFIYKVLLNGERAFLEYEALYEYGLLENTHFMPGDNQNYGNCAFQSHREALRGLLYIELLNEGHTPKMATKQAEAYFQEWNSFLNFYTLKEYFSKDVGLPLEAYTDIFLDFNLTDAPLTQENHAISQTLVNAMLTPEYVLDFRDWLIDAAGEFGKHDLQHIFDPYGVNVQNLISPQSYFHQPLILPEQVTDPLMML